ncbi:MAG: Rab family GTPase [Promethearchaeota archaeon]
MREINQKIVLLGDERVGKTSLIRKFVEGRFDGDYERTLGFEVSESSIVVAPDVELVFTIWDVGRRVGTGKPKNDLHDYFVGANGAIVVFDLSRRETFEHVQRWADYVKKHVPGVKLVLIGNKDDLDAREVGENEVEASRFSIGAGAYFPASAKTGSNVREAFEALAEVLFGEIPA